MQNNCDSLKQNTVCKYRTVRITHSCAITIPGTLKDTIYNWKRKNEKNQVELCGSQTFSSETKFLKAILKFQEDISDKIIYFNAKNIKIIVAAGAGSISAQMRFFYESRKH